MLKRRPPPAVDEPAHEDAVPRAEERESSGRAKKIGDLEGGALEARERSQLFRRSAARRDLSTGPVRGDAVRRDAPRRTCARRWHNLTGDGRVRLAAASRIRLPPDYTSTYASSIPDGPCLA